MGWEEKEEGERWERGARRRGGRGGKRRKRGEKKRRWERGRERGARRRGGGGGKMRNRGEKKRRRRWERGRERGARRGGGGKRGGEGRKWWMSCVIHMSSQGLKVHPDWWESCQQLQGIAVRWTTTMYDRRRTLGRRFTTSTDTKLSNLDFCFSSLFLPYCG